MEQICKITGMSMAQQKKWPLFHSLLTDNLVINRAEISIDKLSKEISRLEAIVNREVVRSRQHFLRLDLPTSYRRLIDLGILHDYTMGYASQVGFRAGTSLPFYFYDLDMETETSLMIHPFAVMDGTLNEYMELPVDDAQYLVKELLDCVKEVDGTFISLWHNETLSDDKHWKDWRQVYEFTIEEALR